MRADPDTESVELATRVDDAGNISDAIDEMFKLDYEDDDETSDSVATEIDLDGDRDRDATVKTRDSRLEDREDESTRARTPDEEMTRKLLALQEELVLTKENWASVCAERALLRTRLAALESPTAAVVAAIVPANEECATSPLLALALALALPVLIAFLFWLLLPYVS